MKRLFTVVDEHNQPARRIDPDDTGNTRGVPAHFQDKLAAKTFRDEMNMGHKTPPYHVSRGPDHRHGLSDRL